jgi:photosystem II stability/assembly factor-like uncharacterized protein
VKKVVVLFILLLNMVLHAVENVWEPTALYGRCCRNFVFDPFRPSVVFGYNPNEIYKSTTSGKNWNRIQFPFDQTETGGVVLRISGSNPAKIFVLSKPFFFRSVDDGRTWVKVGAIPELKSGFDLAIDSQDPKLIYASGATTPVKAFVPTVFRSTDQGKTWKQVLTGSTGATMHVEVHPLQGGVVYARDVKAIFKSTDSGNTWTKNDSIPDGSEAFMIDPVDGNTLYTAARDVFKSTDDGNSWTGLRTHLNTTSIDIDRNDPNTIYVAGSSQLLKSTNGGESWNSLVLAPLLNARYEPWAVAVNPQRNNLVLVWNLHGSTYRSLDAGNSFELITAGGAGGIHRILLFKKKPGKLLVVGHALFHTNDFGKTWKTTTIPVPEAESVYVDDIQLHHANENLVIAVVTNATGTNGFISYLAKSLDDGENWNLIPINEQNILDMALDPVNTNTIYLTLPHKVLKSIDAGATWNRIDETLPPKRFGSIEVDPFNANRLLLTTQGPNVYRSIDGGRTWKISNQGVVFDRSIELRIQFDSYNHRLFSHLIMDLFIRAQMEVRAGVEVATV